MGLFRQSSNHQEQYPCLSILSDAVLIPFGNEQVLDCD
jgi:hypothetical protein